MKETGGLEGDAVRGKRDRETEVKQTSKRECGKRGIRSREKGKCMFMYVHATDVHCVKILDCNCLASGLPVDRF